MYLSPDEMMDFMDWLQEGETAKFTSGPNGYTNIEVTHGLRESIVLFMRSGHLYPHAEAWQQKLHEWRHPLRVDAQGVEPPCVGSPPIQYKVTCATGTGGGANFLPGRSIGGTYIPSDPPAGDTPASDTHPISDTPLEKVIEGLDKRVYDSTDRGRLRRSLDKADVPTKEERSAEVFGRVLGRS